VLQRLIAHTTRTWDFLTFTVFWFSAVGTVANWLGGGSFLTVSKADSHTSECEATPQQGR
jgi:cytosine/uracil/thiamine/allantoin permease